MQKLFLSLLLCSILFCSSAKALSTNEYVSALEKKLFGTTYTNQSIDKRVDRIEMQIYDNSYTGSAEERLEKIDKIYPRDEFEYGKISPQNITSNQYNSYEYEEPEEKADYNNYPIVSEIEQNIYKKNFQGEDIYKRLSRLETELYGNVKTDQSLQERVENLKQLLPKKNKTTIASNFNFDGFAPSDYTQSTGEYFDSDKALNLLEKEAFHRTYDNETSSRRLDRLENFYFGTTTASSVENRLTRLASVSMSSKEMKGYYTSETASQWAGLFLNLLMIGLGFLL